MDLDLEVEVVVGSSPASSSGSEVAGLDLVVVAGSSSASSSGSEVADFVDLGL